jgi:DNA-binding NtrC family response regulator
MPLIEINCAAIPPNLLEAELFGYERGAFTDARQSKPGLIQAAHRGVLFLDEIGSLPLAAQVKLLTVVEQREVRRLGSTRPEPVDVWMFSATNEDLSDLVGRQQFRLDLYHRISAVTLVMPPLRERGRDILTLAGHFLDRVAADYGMPRKQLTPAAEQALRAHSWPGNVRELANLMERSVLLMQGDEITPETLQLPTPRSWSRGAVAEEVGTDPGAERDTLLAELERAQWNLSRAAARLGIPRNTLRYRIERLGLRSPRPALPDQSRIASAPDEAPGAGRLRWERRWITAFQIALESPPSSGAYHLAPLLGELVKKVESFGGRPDELHPLGCTALFGHDPVEDAPLRAALAAQSLRKMVERARDPDPEKITSRIAIHAAESLIARGTPTGGMDLEDRRRLQQTLGALMAAASADTIVVSEAASQFLDRRFKLERLGEHPQLGFTLIGTRRSGFEVGGRIESPFVGRDKELSQLDDLLGDAERGHGQVVGIVGESGVGKSRLLHEFHQGLGRDRVIRLEARCAAHASSTPYLPISQLLRQAFAFTEEDEAATVERRVRDGVAALGLAEARIVPYVLHLLGMTAQAGGELARLSPEAARHRTVDALRQVMIAASQRRPIIVAIEDLQWIDPTSSDSLMSLVDAAAACPILLVATYRQGYQPPWLGRSHATQLVLRRLDSRESLKIVESITVPHVLAPGVADTLVAKADGIPFFLEELVRAVLDHPRDGELAAIPGTIQGVITARLDRLPVADRDLLQAAAVLGKEGPVAPLAAIGGLPDTEFAAAMARLRASEFLRESRVVPVPEYAFTHVLTQDVAYRSLSAERRRGLHRAAAEVIERLSPQTSQRVPELVAHHLTEGGEAELAIPLWHRAGRLAIERSANVEATTHLRKALALLDTRPPGPERGRRELGLDLTLSTALMARGGYGARELEQTLGRIRILTEELADAPEVPPARFGLWRFAVSRANFASAARLAAQLLARGREGEPAVEIPGEVASGITAFYRGHLRPAREHLERALGMQRPELVGAQIGHYGNDLGVASLSVLAWVKALMGELDQGAADAEEALRRARDGGHPLTLAVALNWAGLVRGERHEAARIEEHATELLGLSNEQGFAFFTALGTLSLGWARFVNGERAEAVELLRDGYARYLGAHQRVGLRLRAQLAEALVANDDVEQALALLDESFAHVRDTGEGALLSELHRIRGEALWKRSPGHVEAARSLEEAVTVARRQEAPTLALRAAISLVQRQRETGTAAPAALGTLRDIYTELTEGRELYHPSVARSLLEG